MKKLLNTALFLLASLFATAQWTPTHGPRSALTATDIGQLDGYLVAAQTCGVFVADTSLVWRPVGFDQHGNFTCHAIYDGELFMGGPIGAYRLSHNSGQFQVNNAISYGSPVTDMHADSQALYATMLSNGFGIYRTGMSYIPQNAGLPSDTISMPVPPYFRVIYNTYAVMGNALDVFVGTGKGLYRSPKSAIAWAPVNALPQDTVAALYSQDSLLFAVVGQALYRSTDGGSVWTLQHTFTLHPHEIDKLQMHNQVLFLSTHTQGLQISLDQGQTWTAYNTGLGSSAAHGVANLNGELYLAAGNGISVDHGSWARRTDGLVCSVVVDLAQTATCIAANTLQGLSISTDDGMNWNDDVTTGLGISATFSVITIDNALFFSSVPTNFNNPASNYSTTDCGGLWTSPSSLTNYGDPYLLRNIGDTVIACTDNILLRSTDGGVQWATISPPPQMTCNNYNDVLLTANAIYVAACGNSEVIRSTDDGATWSFVLFGLPWDEIKLLREAGGWIFAATATELYRSDDQGQNWFPCHNGIGSSQLPIQDITYHAGRFYLCDNHKVYASADGENWTDISQGLPSLPDWRWGGALLVRGGTLYYGTSIFGVWQRDLSNIVVAADAAVQPPSLKLAPNPARDRVHVAGLQGTRRVEAQDALGRAMPVTRVADAIEIGEWPTGIYFIRVTDPAGQVRVGRLVKE